MMTGPLITAAIRVGSSSVTDGDCSGAPSWQARNAATAVPNTDAAIWPPRAVSPAPVQHLSLQLPLAVGVDHRDPARDRPIAAVVRERRRGAHLLEPETWCRPGHRHCRAGHCRPTVLRVQRHGVGADPRGSRNLVAYRRAGFRLSLGARRGHERRQQATGDQHRRQDQPHRKRPHKGTIVNMQLTHFGHSCLLAEFGQTRLLFDPGTFSHGFEGITGLSAILITHQHPDHIDVTRLPTLLEDNPAAELYADPQTAAQLGEPWRAVHVGDELPLAELTVRAVGGCHAVIHPEIPVIENISYLVGDSKHRARLMHPGDALFVPGEQVDVLATPAAAPWMKISEAVDYLRAVAPARAVPIHQAIVAPDARGIYYGRLTEMTTTDFQVLPEESAVTF